MYNEIGSEFWTNCTPHLLQGLFSMRPQRIYEMHPYKVVETLSGRTALEHIVEVMQHRGMKKAYLTSYCCHTMIEPFVIHGFRVAFYDIWLTKEGIHREVNLTGNDCEVVLLMDYFGHTDSETVEVAKAAKATGKVVIYDATHSLYSDVDYSPYDFIYGSYRKWVDINCGFLTWKEDLYNGEITQSGCCGAYVEKRKELFDKKAIFMKGGAVEKDDFLPLINEAESILEKEYHHGMPDARSKEVLKTTDAEFVKFRRMANARVLTEGINSLGDARVTCVNPLLNTYDVPLFVPIMVAEGHRDKLRRHLIGKEIYCPVHWPKSDLHRMMAGSEPLFDCELSLICDQRYDKNDMLRIIEEIRNYLEQ